MLSHRLPVRQVASVLKGWERGRGYIARMRCANAVQTIPFAPAEQEVLRLDDRLDFVELVHLVVNLVPRLAGGGGDTVGRLVQQMDLLVPVDIVPPHDDARLVDHVADEFELAQELPLEAVDVLGVEPSVGGHVLQTGCVHLRHPGGCLQLPSHPLEGVQVLHQILKRLVPGPFAKVVVEPGLHVVELVPLVADPVELFHRLEELVQGIDGAGGGLDRIEDGELRPEPMHRRENHQDGQHGYPYLGGYSHGQLLAVVMASIASRMLPSWRARSYRGFFRTLSDSKASASSGDTSVAYTPLRSFHRM